MIVPPHALKMVLGTGLAAGWVVVAQELWSDPAVHSAAVMFISALLGFLGALLQHGTAKMMANRSQRRAQERTTVRPPPPSDIREER